jgi:hypothetical protein
MPRISYFPADRIEDPELAAYLDRAAREGAPRPEIQSIRAHVPAVLRSFSRTWYSLFHGGIVDHKVKELCRVYVSTTLECHY